MFEDLDAKELFLQAKEGNKNSFDRIYEIFAVPVYRYILLRTKHKQTCEDLTQAVFLKAYNSLQGYKDTGKTPLAWLFTIARNTIIDHFRKNSKIQIDPDDILMNLPARENFVEELNQNQNIGAVKNLISKLSEEQREVILLKFVSDLSNAEISAILGKSEESIRQLQSRGIKNLRKMAEK